MVCCNFHPGGKYNSIVLLLLSRIVVVLLWLLVVVHKIKALMEIIRTSVNINPSGLVYTKKE